MSSAKQSIDYAKAQDFFVEVAQGFHPAEVWHGWLAGYLVSDHVDQMAWYEHAQQWLDAQMISLDETQKTFLDDLMSQTELQLSRDKETFVPLLPEDKEPLEKRVKATATWAESFLLGFASSPISEDGMSDDAKEALSDLSDISKAVIGDDEEINQLESFYKEIVEHLALLAKLMFQECAQKEVSSTVH